MRELAVVEQRYEAVPSVIADGDTVTDVAARFELAKRGVGPVSESAAYRALVRLNLIDPAARRPRDRKWKRWVRGAPMELWQMDVVGGFMLAVGSHVKGRSPRG
jgi:hypothetical protein